MNKTEKALSLFSNNFNCSQAVFTAFAGDFGIDEKTALMLGASFGGGARNGEICGAVLGALLVLGLKYGHYDAEDNLYSGNKVKIIFDDISYACPLLNLVIAVGFSACIVSFNL